MEEQRKMKPLQKKDFGKTSKGELATVYTLENEAGRNGAVYQKRDAVCLETQNYPDAVHQKNFPEAICKKGEPYASKTAYRFHIE